MKFPILTIHAMNRHVSVKSRIPPSYSVNPVKIKAKTIEQDCKIIAYCQENNALFYKNNVLFQRLFRDDF